MNKMIVILVLIIFGLVVLPATVNALTVKAVYPGYRTSFAVDSNGILYVWGSFNGENYARPTIVSFIDHVAMVAPTGTGCAVVLKDDGTVWAWGSMPSRYPALYPGENSSTPVKINISDVKYIAFGANAIYMVKEDGSLWSCGANYDHMMLGNTDFSGDYSLEPVRIFLDDVSRVIVTTNFAFAEKEDGSWWGWGHELSHGTITGKGLEKLQLDNVKSMAIRGTSFVVNDVRVSWGIIFALTGDGKVYSWGSDAASLSVSNDLATDLIQEIDNVKEIGYGTSFYVALKRDGTVWTWGDNPSSFNRDIGSLTSKKPIRVPSLSDIVAISVGSDHCFAFKSDGTVWAWGRNQDGELGDGQIINNAGGNSGMPKGVRVADLYVDMPQETATATPSAIPTTPGPTDSATITIIPSSTVQTPTDTPMASQASGFDFTTIMAMIGLLFVGSLAYLLIRK
jgi:alpha-tubulin suppressor-like RCC1 family protein